jgi:hypothetical protein
MSATEVERQVRDEWRDAEGGFNPHGLRVDRNLVSPPRLMTLRNSFFERDSAVPFRRRATLRMWVVIDEAPGSDNDGYLIVFDDEQNTYGLAAKPDVFLGYYGTLSATIAGM